MKIIFDNLGAVREGDYANEIINQGSHNVNKIYFAIENEEAQNNYLNYIATASFTFSNQESVSDVVMSATRFSFNDVEYNGYLLSLGKTLTAISGETSITFRIKDNTGNTILTTQPIVKTITRTDGNNKVINITEAQYESLLEAVNNKVSVESGEAKNLKVKGILTIEAENGESVNVECYGQGELKIPTLYAENINGNKVYGEQGTFGSITLDDIGDSDSPLKILNYKGTLYRNENAEGYQYLIKSEIETKDAETLNSAKSYTDAEKTKVLSESKTYTDGVFANGQTYTNNEINKIKDGTYLVGKAEKDINGNRIDLTYQGKTLSVQIGSYKTVEQALQGLKQEIEVLIGGTINQEDLDTLKEISDAVFKARNDITALQEAINDIVLSNVPVATENTAGIVKIGNNINVTADGTISIDLSAYSLKSELPTNISQLNNDSGFIKNESNAFNYNNLSNKPTIPTNTSQLNNDSGYLTQEDITEEVSQTVECDHEYEITGNTGDEHGLAVKDQQVVIEKIQGQTRRYSENEFIFDETNFVFAGVNVNYDIETGIITLNGTVTSANSTKNLHRYKVGYLGQVGIKYEFISGEIVQVSSERPYDVRIILGKADLSATATVSNVSDDRFKTFDSSLYNEDIILRIAFNQFIIGTVFTNYKFRISIVKGKLTESTMPAFQPYDNTLVNSKCNLISTNKNLCKELIFNNANRYNDSHYLDKNILKPNKTYTMKFKTKNTGAEIYRSEETTDAWISFTCDGKEKTYTFTTRNVLKIINNKIQLFKNSSDNSGMLDSDTIYDFMLVYGSTAPTEYIPYEQDTFNFNVELGEFDTFDNIANKITRQTSPIKTYQQGETLPSEISNGYVANRELSENELSTLNVESEVQFAYKLATQTTEEYVAPNGYQVWNGGLQQQVIEGKYLPYVITKKYSVSIGAQLDANRSIDRGQQEQIDILKTDVDALKQQGGGSGGLKVKEIYFDETQIAKLLEITTTGGEITLNETVSGDYDCVDIFAAEEKLSRLINNGGSYVAVNSSNSSIVGNSGTIYTLMELSINVYSNTLKILYTPDFGKIRHYRHTIIASVEITELGNFVDIPFIYITRQTALINSSDRFSKIIEHVSRGYAYTNVKVINLSLNQTNMELYIYNEKTLSYITKVIEYSAIDFRDTISEV